MEMRPRKNSAFPDLHRRNSNELQPKSKAKQEIPLKQMVAEPKV